MEFIKKNFLFVVILSLVVIIFLERWEKVKIASNKQTIVKDTVWLQKDSIIYSNPRLEKTILPTIIEKHYIADTSKVKLTEQYNQLVKLYLSKNIHKEKVNIDSIGYIEITDTVTKNLIKGRKLSYVFNYPVITKTITNTITNPVVKRNQLYFGGGLQGNPITPVKQIDAGILFKNKKDQIYEVFGGLDINGQFQYGAKMYWKLSFRKNDN